MFNLGPSQSSFFPFDQKKKLSFNGKHSKKTTKDWNCLARDRISFWGNSWRDCLLTTCFFILAIFSKSVFQKKISIYYSWIRCWGSFILTFTSTFTTHLESKIKCTGVRAGPRPPGGAKVNCEHSLDTSVAILSIFQQIFILFRVFFFSFSENQSNFLKTSGSRRLRCEWCLVQAKTTLWLTLQMVGNRNHKQYLSTTDQN